FNRWLYVVDSYPLHARCFGSLNSRDPVFEYNASFGRHMKQLGSLQERICIGFAFGRLSGADQHFNKRHQSYNTQGLFNGTPAASGNDRNFNLAMERFQVIYDMINGKRLLDKLLPIYLR